MTHILLVRHGTTQWIEQGRLHGRLDSPLSARGQAEAARVAAYLRGAGLVALYSSPAGRAMETAEAIARATGLQPILLDGLREIDFGWMEGQPLAPREGHAFSRAQLLRWALWMPIYRLTSEPRAVVRRRVAAALDQISAEHPHGRATAVIHSGVHSAILDWLFPTLRVPGQHLHPFAACAITELEYSPGQPPQLVRMNDKAHLEGM